ncbi:hypothetical protein ACJMK2_007803 [Sinanodonta woodiana]|uniref:Uncharacterized protein n=1 Tax=Sinanodonta woodiana TaxID=1069815 RepID=A0ABD3VJM1_SINWO
MRFFIVLCLSICLLLGKASAQGQGNNLFLPLLLSGGDLGGDSFMRMTLARSLFGGGADQSAGAGAGGTGGVGGLGGAGTALGAAGAGSTGMGGGCSGSSFWLCLALFN